MRLANEKTMLEVVADQRGCPTSAEDLANVLRTLATGTVCGLLHVTNSGDCTWHGFAEAIVRQMGLPTIVRPISTAQAGRPAKRPAYSVLAQERLATLGQRLPHWQDALARCMKRMTHLAPATS